LRGVVIAAERARRPPESQLKGQEPAIRGCDLFRYFFSIDHAILKAGFHSRSA
jgi:hypothetical protein